MAGRVIVVPHADGVIRVRCGATIVEAEVDTSGGQTSAAGGGVGSPADNPILALRLGGGGAAMSVTWADRAVRGAFAVETTDARGLSRLADAAHAAARASPGPDAPTVRVDADTLDVHLLDGLRAALSAGGDYTLVANLRGDRGGKP
jgi:hypothetical protein